MPDLTLKLAILRRVTAKALLLSWCGQDLWIPRTQFRALPDPLPHIGAQMTCAVSEWIAQQKGLTETGIITQTKPQDAREAALLARIKALETDLIAARLSRSSSSRREAEAQRRAEFAESQLESLRRTKNVPVSGTAAELMRQVRSASVSTPTSTSSPTPPQILERSRFSLLEPD
jgi:hypothetical protein